MDLLADKDPYQEPSPFLLTCNSGHNIQKICINEECQFNSFCCHGQSCENNLSIHKGCQAIQYSYLAKQIQEKISFNQIAINDLLKAETEIFNLFTQSRSLLIQKLRFGGIHENVQKIFNSIYFQKNVQNIKGRQINELIQTLSQLNFKVNYKDILQDFKQEIQKYFKPIEKLRQTFANKILSSKKIIIKELQSNILTNSEQGNKMMTYLMKELENPISFNLLFRASEHNFQAIKFHQHCHGFTNTLTIIKNQFNKTVAAFTPIAWKSAGNFIADKSKRTFILQLDLQEKMTLIEGKEQFAIFDYYHYGPSFGGQPCDIFIADRCNKNRNSSMDFPNCYNCNDKYKRSQQACTAICGAQIGSQFKVIQYEVFQVIFNQ